MIKRDTVPLNSKPSNFEVAEKKRQSDRRKFKILERKLSAPEKELVATIKKNEEIRHKLAIATEKLKESYDVLDRKVVERTSELKEAYATLEKKVRDRTQSLEDANLAIQNVIEDLNAEKSNSEMIRAKEEAMLLSIGDGLLACDEKRRIILMNKSAERMLGWKSAEVIGKDFSNIVVAQNEKGEVVPLAQRPLSTALSFSATTAITVADPTYFYMRKDKTRFPVSILVTPIILNGKVIGAVDAFRDITHEKEVDRAKSEFVALASHQLRTPLTSISWYSEMILSGDAGVITPGQKKYFDRIYEGNKRMIELVDALLNVSRIEIGTFKISPEPIDIVIIAKNAIDEQKEKIVAKRIKFTKRLGNNIPMLHADPELLRMVFQNILSNAVKYTPSGGEVRFTISFSAKRGVTVKISDTGFGIPKAQQNQIFTKLFRADNVRLKDIDGTGLGLYIAKSVVDNSGGKIWFKSEENKGSTFYVMFPLDKIRKK